MTTWSQEQKETLRELWDRKPRLSAAEIGQIMGFGRNAIIGCAHRMNLPSRALVRDPKAPPKPRKPRATFNRVIPFRRPPTPVLAPPIPAKPPAEAIPFSRLEKGTCRAITRMGSLLYSSESMYCGAPVVPGKAWCQHHFALYTEKRSRR